MCGFVAVIGKRTEKEAIGRALELIRHRGPDDIGIWQNPDKTVSFGHARLSIIDLQGGVQPLSNHDQSVVAVVNGELYDYKKIRADLEQSGYTFKTHSDSEILLGLYERYGDKALNYLRGEYAFVLWDKRKDRVLAGRDRFGIKPLHYYQDQEAIYLASEAKAFSALGIKLAFDDETFYHAVCLLPHPQSHIFANVKQVLPGHCLIHTKQSLTQKKYWDFNYPKIGQSRVVNEEEAALTIRELFRESVGLRLEADVPVACYLSGGIDSCAVLGMAQSLSDRPIHAFTLTFEHQAYDEAQEAEEMAAMVKAPYHPIAITQNEIANNLFATVWHAERFVINGHAVAKFLLSKAVRDAGFKVVLTGEGSDEIFGGYAHFRQDQILYSGQWSEQEKAQLLEVLKSKNQVSGGFLLNNDMPPDAQYIIDRVGFLPGWIRGFSVQGQLIEGLLSAELKSHVSNSKLLASFLDQFDIEGQVSGRDCLSKSLYLWSKHTLPYYLLTVLGDRMEMAHSIEGRLPFLDHKLVEYVVSLPSDLKINHMTEKYILRQAAKPFITKTIYERQKHPFLAPPASLSPGDNHMSVLVQDTLRSTAFRNLPYFDHNKVLALLENVPHASIEQKVALDSVFLVLVSAAALQARIASLHLSHT